MDTSLVWKDLSSAQIEEIRHPHPKKGLTPRALLAKYTGISDPADPKQGINLDLYTQTLRFGEGLGMTDDKLSALFSIVKDVHTAATSQRLHTDRAFVMFKDLLMAHSVERPPASVALFTLQEMKDALQWGLDAYFRHYKLYQYAFTDRVLTSVAQAHSMDGVETLAAVLQLRPLADAMTEEQHAAVVGEEQRKVEEAARAQAEAEAEAAEVERQARLREEYVAAVPDEVRDQVAAAVERELALLKARMEEQFAEQSAALQARLGELEAAQAAVAAPVT